MVDVDFTPRPVYFAVTGATSSLRVAQPGEHEDTHPALLFGEGWQNRIEKNASGGQLTSSEIDGATAKLAFYGEGLDVRVHRKEGAGRLFVTIDGRVVSGLPRDETGRSFIEEASGAEQWRAVVPVARNLARGEHIFEFRAEGDVNLDGFVIPEIPVTQPPWIVIGVFGVLGVAALGLAVATVQSK